MLVDLRSDTVTRPTPEMRRAMADAEVGDDVYAEDPTVNRLEGLFAEMVGKDAALYVPTGTSAVDYAATATTVMCCLSKGLCAPVGSMLAGPADVMTEARGERQRLGGGMRQAGIIAAAGIVALQQMVERLAEDHARARRLADAVAERWPDGGCDPVRVRTNIVTFRHPAPGKLLDHLQ